MTAEGYDYEYALTTSIHDEWGYGSYSSTTGTFAVEVTVDPPAWTCGSCRKDKRLWTQQAAAWPTSCAARRRGTWPQREHRRKEPAALFD